MRHLLWFVFVLVGCDNSDAVLSADTGIDTSLEDVADDVVEDSRTDSSSIDTGDVDIVKDMTNDGSDIHHDLGSDMSTISPELLARLYPDWCESGLRTPADTPATIVRVSPGSSIQSAIDSTENSVVLLETGTHVISMPILMKGGVIVRGEDGAVVTTSTAMSNMVQFGGGYGNEQNTTVAVGNTFERTFRFSGDVVAPGLWLLGDGNGGQLVRVLSVAGDIATIEHALVEEMAGKSIQQQRDPIQRSGLEDLTLRPAHDVLDVIELRSAEECWVSGVSIDGVGGQIRSGVYLRQAYRSFIDSCIFKGAKEHGDGGQGYGINISNNSSSNLISYNILRDLRHSILLQEGASANRIFANDSAYPIHPNFVDGGPADISFHAYGSANLAEFNHVERIQINDAGEPGPNNTIAFNTLSSGPLTLDNDVDQLTLLSNVMAGDVQTLRARVMPSVDTDSSAGRPSPPRSFWLQDYDPFEGPGGSSGFTERGVGILDWGSGDDIYIDAELVRLPLGESCANKEAL